MADESVQAQDRGGKGRSRFVPIVVVAVLMVGEGIGVYFLANLVSPDPTASVAAGLDGAKGGEGDAQGLNDLAEVEIAECRPTNKMSGKMVSFQLRVSALVHQTEVERAVALIEHRNGRLRDRINFVIRSVEIQHLNEPGLETIKRRLKHEFDRVFDDENLVQEVLIPEILQSGGGV
jgi:flagellar basal body-associated protein FliL